MEVIYKVCCGIDVHKKTLVACMRKGRKKEIREFGGNTKDIRAMAAWLKSNDCELVAMESTSVYWKPLVNIFELEDINYIVINAKEYKNVPGRKTDVQDSEWISDLLRHGLLKSSFIPTREQRELRDATRYRKSITQEKTRAVNRLHKMLECANIKLSSVVSDIQGVSSKKLLAQVIENGGAISIEQVESLITTKLSASKEELAEALEGIVTPLQKFMMEEVISHIDALSQNIAKMDAVIEAYMEGYLSEIEKLIEIPGIGLTSAQIILAEIGLDMNQFPTAGHLASWAGLSPGNNESAGKKKSGKSRKGNQILKSTLVQSAKTAVKNKQSFYYAQYQRLAVKRGKNRATVAVAHSMLIAIYHILKNDKKFVDLGVDYYNQFNTEKKANSYRKKLAALGYEVDLKKTG